MQWAADAGLLVVLDMHQDVYGIGFAAGGGDGAPLWTCDQAHYDAFVPADDWFLNYGNEHVIACYDHFYGDAATRERFVAAWGHVAERPAGAPAIIGFDVLNEPFWGSYGTLSFEPEVLGPLYADVVTRVRAAAPGWVAFLEPAASRNLGLPTGFTTPFPFADVVYAPHAYDSGAEAGGGFPEAQRQAYLENVAALAAEARALDAALWIGEYGGYGDGLTGYMDAAYDAAGEAAAGNMLWSYDKGGSYSILLADGSERPELVAAVVRPYPMRVAGDPVRWRWDDATGAFTLTFHSDARIAAPTEIALPPRLYPGGADVACGGCTVELAPGVARLGAVPAGADGTATVTITAR
jgi:endoglycosylceramidase